MNYLFVIIGILFLGWVYYQVQKRIGEDQAAEWAQYKLDHPDEFRQPTYEEKLTAVKNLYFQLFGKHIKEVAVTDDLGKKIKQLIVDESQSNIRTESKA